MFLFVSLSNKHYPNRSVLVGLRFFNFIYLLFGVLIDRQIFSSLTQNEVMLSLLNIILYIYRNCTISCLPGSIFKLYSKQSRDFLLYTKKEMNCVLFYDEIWLLLLHPE